MITNQNKLEFQIVSNGCFSHEIWMSIALKGSDVISTSNTIIVYGLRVRHAHFDKEAELRITFFDFILFTFYKIDIWKNHLGKI